MTTTAGVILHSPVGMASTASAVFNVASVSARSCQLCVSATSSADSLQLKANLLHIVLQAVRNFIQLCLEGYYDGCIFHRVIKDVMVQTGDPTGTGEGE